MAKADKDKHCTQHNVYNENNFKKKPIIIKNK